MRTSLQLPSSLGDEVAIESQVTETDGSSFAICRRLPKSSEEGGEVLVMERGVK
jgi:hypothetical protein